MEQLIGSSKTPGLSCPVCGKYIPISIVMLLSGSGLDCRYCGLHLEIDKEQSGKVLRVLAELNEMHGQVEDKRQF